VQQLTIGLHSTSSNHRSNNCIMHCNSWLHSNSSCSRTYPATAFAFYTGS
jgi:hypothetical protein